MNIEYNTFVITYDVFNIIRILIEFQMNDPVWVFILNVCIIYCVQIIEYSKDENPSRNGSST